MGFVPNYEKNGNSKSTIWNSPVLIALLTVTIPLLIGQYLNANNVTDKAVETAEVLAAKDSVRDDKADSIRSKLLTNDSVNVLLTKENAALRKQIRILERK